jgi:hypothetical protein
MDEQVASIQNELGAERGVKAQDYRTAQDFLIEVGVELEFEMANAKFIRP